MDEFQSVESSPSQPRSLVHRTEGEVSGKVIFKGRRSSRLRFEKTNGDFEELYTETVTGVEGCREKSPDVGTVTSCPVRGL